MRLLYLIFGTNVQNHFQANFSILSFLKQKDKILDGILVVTDAPDYYNHLSDAVEVYSIQQNTLQEWRGEYDFFWRIKIKALEFAARKYPSSPLLYVDTDTFLYGSLKSMHSELSAGTAFMHESEGALSTLASKTERIMWQQTKGKPFGGVEMTQDIFMWNAGVIAIPGYKTFEAVSLALAICDDLCAAQVTPRLIEQLALSIALTKTFHLQEAKVYIGHYWSVKELWNLEIAAFLLESHLQNRTTKDDLDALDLFDYSKIPVKIKSSNTKHRLNRFVNKILPPRQIEFIRQSE